MKTDITFSSSQRIVFTIICVKTDIVQLMLVQIDLSAGPAWPFTGPAWPFTGSTWPFTGPAWSFTGPGSKILRDLNTHWNPTLKFYNEELFIYKCCCILCIFCEQQIKQIQVIFFRMHNTLWRGKKFDENRKSVIMYDFCKKLLM